MPSAEMVKLPKDCKGQTLHLPYEVLVCCDSNSVTQGGVTSLTLAMLCPAAWYFGPHMGAICGRSEEPESIEVSIDDNC